TVSIMGLTSLFANGRRRVSNPWYAVDWADAGGEADGVVNDQPAWRVVGDRIRGNAVRGWRYGFAPHRQAGRSRNRRLLRGAHGGDPRPAGPGRDNARFLSRVRTGARRTPAPVAAGG